jgi:Tol biopolymer transport system component
VLLANTGSGVGIQTLPVSGGAPTMVLAGGSSAWPSWTPDGRIMFVSYIGSVDSLKVMNADGTGVTTLFTESAVGVSSINSAMMSPDGTKVAFNAPYAGNPALWVANIDGTGSTRIRSVGGLGTEMLVWITTPASSTPTTTTSTTSSADPVAPAFTG